MTISLQKQQMERGRDYEDIEEESDDSGQTEHVSADEAQWFVEAQ